MSPVKIVLAKELRTYFLSPVALIFLGIFLVANLFVFFSYSTFFARSIADVRPMFEWLPILLILLVAAISMRSWSEEQAGGTLEILMTMPISTLTLVLGKLLSGILLIAIALLLTLPLPIMVSLMGNLDSGPVIGGYLGALFLGTTYLAIGMCVSSKTDNQIVSLMMTAVVGTLFYLIGSDTIAAFFSTGTAEVLRQLGSGSRFYNIERGVLDFRDVFYYLSVAAFFVALNVHFIDMKRMDTQKPQGRRRARSRVLTMVLLGANMLLVNIWMAPVRSLRADLTENRIFSISNSTRQILENLTEPVLIAGYFSDKTHPLLAPLVPHIRDYLAEYENAGGNKVIVRFENPNTDEDLESEIAQSYNIRPLPFRVAARHQQSVVNAYFHVLVKYGDEYVVLSIDDLIEVDRSGEDINVRLRNLEYDVTRSIKRVSSGFLSIEAVFAAMTEDSRLTLFVTPSTLPEDMKEIPTHVQAAADDLVNKSRGKFKYDVVDLDQQPGQQQELREKYGFQPMATDIFAENTFFLHLLLTTGNRDQRIILQGAPTEAAIRSAIEGTFKRSTPGFMKTIGIFTLKPDPTPQNPQMPPHMQPPQERPDFQTLEQQLRQEFKVERVDLTDGHVPGNIDVLIIAKPGDMTDEQKFAIDQYLMGGGAMIALTGEQTIKVDQSGISGVPDNSGIRDMLRTWGVNVLPGFVLDSQNANFPVPVEERRGMFVMRRVKMMEYPFFPDIRQDGFQKGHVAVSGLQNVIYNWGSAIEVSEKEGISSEVLLRTSDQSWTHTSPQVLPTSFDNASMEFTPPSQLQSYALAAALEGRFESYFKDKPSPLFSDTPVSVPQETDANDESSEEPRTRDRTGRTLKESVADARLIVVGSSEILSDLTASVGEQVTGNMFASNFQFARNLIDWTLADTDLLGIRTGGALARTLRPMTERETGFYELANYLFVLLSLIALAMIFFGRRRKATSLLETEGAK